MKNEAQEENGEKGFKDILAQVFNKTTQLKADIEDILKAKGIFAIRFSQPAQAKFKIESKMTLYAIKKDEKEAKSIALKDGDWTMNIINVKIIHPKVKEDLENGETLKAIFDTTSFPYCFENQGVSKEAYGDVAKQRIKKIEGKITPEDNLEYEWHLGELAGSLNPLEGNTTPDHSPPDTAAIAGTQITLSLSLKDNLNFIDTKNVVIFKDHLARDVVNFADFSETRKRKCVPYIEISETIFADVGLGCGIAFIHAHNGTTSGDPLDLFNSLASDTVNWIYIEYKGKADWVNFEKENLPRGTKLMLIKRSSQGTFPSSGHPATIAVTGTGKTSISYAGDTLRDNFVHKNVEWYFVNVLQENNPDNYKIRVIKPK